MGPSLPGASARGALLAVQDRHSRARRRISGCTAEAESSVPRSNRIVRGGKTGLDYTATAGTLLVA